tara:strand:+ start:3481 stop:4149 length:669 start_codon:yes stop_codon:yes gene_type:complete
MKTVNVSSLLKAINYEFKNKELLLTAITHSSFNDNSKKKNYERLEFLGDRVIGLVISEVLYSKFYDETEGKLAKRFSYLVCKDTLIEIARNLKLESYLQISKDIKNHNSILANSLEAVIAALFLDAGYLKTKKIVLLLWNSFLNKHDDPPNDPKSQLQDWCLKNKKILPSYSVINKVGPDHDPVFKIRVFISDDFTVTAKGKNKQKAEIKAAQILLKKLNNE